LKIVGKIDLESINERTKPAKKSPEERRKEREQKRKPERTKPPEPEKTIAEDKNRKNQLKQRKPSP